MAMRGEGGALARRSTDRMTLEAKNKKGSKKNLKCDGLLSTCVQHEINHLDGKLIIDHLSKLKKDFIIKKISKIKKNLDRVVV